MYQKQIVLFTKPSLANMLAFHKWYLLTFSQIQKFKALKSRCFTAFYIMFPG